VETARVLRLRHLAGLGAVVAVALGALACGGAGPGTIVARVGGVAITKGMVDRRVAVTSRRRGEALDFLIRAEWSIGEASRRGLSISDQEIERALAAKQSTAFPGGEGEFEDFLRATGERLADAELEAKAELASADLRDTVARNTPAVTDAAVSRFYHRHLLRYVVPERRVAEITNRKTLVAADTLRKEVEAGRSLLSAAQRRFNETSITARGGPPGQAPVERLIYAARPHALTGPARLGADYVLFRVTRVVPARHRAFGRVRAAIERQLRGDEQRKALAAFNEAWQARWLAQTACAPGYVIHDCRQYTGPKAAASERRYFDIVERIPTPGAARQVEREIKAGRLAPRAIVHESLDRSALAAVASDRHAAVKAIFAAPVGVVTGPVPLYRWYAIFVVNRIVPVGDIR
jgi:parvulin-like peptidyl-prolyl isomerase